MGKLEANAEAAEILTRLYESEISATVRWFWDAGFEWEAWAPTSNDPGSDGVASTLHEATREMAESAASRYPDSEFARWWKGRGR